MCTWFYADYKALENYITSAQKSPLANEIMLSMSRSVVMTGDIRPTDVAAVIASGRSGNMVCFRWCRDLTTKIPPSLSSTAVSRQPTKRTYGESHGIPDAVRYQLHGTTSGAFSLQRKDTTFSASNAT